MNIKQEFNTSPYKYEDFEKVHSGKLFILFLLIVTFYYALSSIFSLYFCFLLSFIIIFTSHIYTKKINDLKIKAIKLFFY